MLKNIKIFVIPGGGGKTTLSKKNNKFIDIDDFWDITGQTETKMIQEFKEARKNNNDKLVKKIINDCMNYKAIKLKNSLNNNNYDSIILVQSVEQANIINNDNKNIICFVPSEQLHESLMEKRKDSDFIKNVCRYQRKKIINSGLKFFCYYDFNEFEKLINQFVDLN